jgi:hypothetical protein
MSRRLNIVESCNLTYTIHVYVYFQIMVNALRMIDFTECCHQEEYLQDIDHHSRDFESLGQCLEGVILMVTS